MRRKWKTYSAEQTKPSGAHFMDRIGKVVRAFIKASLGTFIPPIYRMRYRSSQNAVVPSPGEPKKILLLNGAHVGDLVISTSILPILRSAYPSVEIGFVVGSWSSMVIKNHPDVAFIHLVDHWLLNRSKASRLRKIQHYRKTYKTALDEIRDTGYDMALCIFPYFLPDYMDLAWRAGIPIRLGFPNSVFASLATATTNLSTSPFFHQAALQAEVLKPLSIDERHLAKRKSVLAPSTDDSRREVLSLLNVATLRDTKYCVIHLGAGAINREMPNGFWREIAVNLSKSHLLLFTGRGDREESNVVFVMDGLKNCINACNRLSWNGFVEAVRHADVLYGVESMAGHVAAAVDTPSIVVYSGVAGVARWRPEGDLTTAFTNHLPCAPCGNIRGCHPMTCLKAIKPLDLLLLPIPKQN